MNDPLWLDRLYRSATFLTLALALVACGSGDSGSNDAAGLGASPNPSGGWELVEGTVVKTWADEVVGKTATLQGSVTIPNSVAFIWPDGAFTAAYDLRVRADVADSELRSSITEDPEQLPAGATLVDTTEIIVGERPQTSAILRRSMSPLASNQAYVAYAFGLQSSEDDEVLAFLPLEGVFDMDTSAFEVTITPEAFRYDDSDETNVVQRVLIAMFRVDDTVLEEEKVVAGKSGLEEERVVISKSVLEEEKTVVDKSILGNVELDAAPFVASRQVSGSAVSPAGPPHPLCPPVTEPLIIPSERGLINSLFGWRPDPFNPKKGNMHNALDWRAGANEPVRAMRPGVVSYIGYQLSNQITKEGKLRLNADGTSYRRGLGCAIKIRHNDGMVSTYGHLACTEPSDADLARVFKATGHLLSFDTSRLGLPVRVGTAVETGDQIAFTGKSGTVTAHQHVTYESLKVTTRTVGRKRITKPIGKFDYRSCMAGRYFGKVDFKGTYLDYRVVDILTSGPIGATVIANVTPAGESHCRSSHDPASAQSSIDWTLRYLPLLADAVCTRERIEQRYMFTSLDKLSYLDGSAEVAFEGVDDGNNHVLDAIVLFPGSRIDVTMDGEEPELPQDQWYFAKSSAYVGFRAFNLSE